MRLCPTFIFVLLAVCASPSARAGSPIASSLPPNPFAQGQKEIQSGVGAFFSIDSDGPTHPTINYALENIRFGLMLTDPRGSGLLAGNLEFLIEVSAAKFSPDPAQVWAERPYFCVIISWRPNAMIIPYFQIGGGGAYSNIDDDNSQTLVGSRFEFNLQGGFGVRVPVNDRFSIYLEPGYRHISNAGLAHHNSGLNSFGGSAGMIFSF